MHLHPILSAVYVKVTKPSQVLKFSIELVVDLEVSEVRIGQSALAELLKLSRGEIQLASQEGHFTKLKSLGWVIRNGSWVKLETGARLIL